jgi:hypothetical protein
VQGWSKLLGGVAASLLVAVVACGSLTAPDGETPIDAGVADAPAAPPPVTADGGCGGPVSWLDELDGSAASALAIDPDGRLFAGGSAGTRGWLAEIDRCDGGVVREVTFDVPDASSMHVQGLVATADRVVAVGVAGDQSQTGAYARFDKSLAAQATLSFPAPATASGLDDVALADDGAVWASGFAGFGLGGWVVRFADDAVSCQIHPTPVTRGVLALAGGEAVVMKRDAANVVTFDQLSPTCAASVASAPPPLPSGLRGERFGRANGAYYVVGSAGGVAADDYAFAATSADGGAWVTSANIDPTPGVVGLPYAAGRFDTDGVDLILSGASNEGVDAGAPALWAFGLPLAANAPPSPAGTPFGAKTYFVASVKLVPAGVDAFYVAGVSVGGGAAIAGCRKSTGCTR